MTGDLEHRIRSLEKENLSLNFYNKQYLAQTRKLERECIDLNRLLKSMQYCGACRCLSESRRKDIHTAKVQDVKADIFPTTSASVKSHSAALKPPLSSRLRDLTNGADFLKTDNQGLQEKIGSLQSELERKQEEIDRLRAASPSATVANLLVQKDNQILSLQGKVGELEQTSSSRKHRLEDLQQVKQAEQRRFSHTEQQLAEVQSEVEKFKEELLRLRSERQKVWAENDVLRNSLSSKETNLQRCEKQLSQTLSEKRNLEENLRESETKTKCALEELKAAKEGRGAGFSRWRSESQLQRKQNSLSRSATLADVAGSRRLRDVNPYCPVCRELREELQLNYYSRQARRSRGESSGSRGRRLTADSPDSGFDDCKEFSENKLSRKLMAEVGDLSAEKRNLMEQIQKLGEDKQAAEADKESARQKQNQIEFENKRLRDEINRLRTSSVTAAPQSQNGIVQNLRQQNDRLTEQTNDAKSRLHTESARYEANLSLLNVQKAQLEKEKNELRSKVANLEERISVMQRDMEAQRARVHSLNEETRKKDTRSDHDGDRLLRAKEAEVAQLKNTIKDLDNEYQRFRNSLLEQEKNLLKLQHDLSVSESLKGQTEKQNQTLVEEYSKLQEQLQKQIQDNINLQRELEQSVDEQEQLKLRTQQCLNEVQSYEHLLAEKERERTEMLIQLQKTSLPAAAVNQSTSSLDVNLKDIEIQSLKAELESCATEKITLLEQQRLLEEQLLRCRESLSELQTSLDGTRHQNDSLHADLQALRQLLLVVEAEKQDLNKQLKEKNKHIQNLDVGVEGVKGEMESVRGKLARERQSVQELQEALSNSRQQQVQAAVDLQEKTTELRRLKEKLADYQTQIELQDRELKRIRGRLADLERGAATSARAAGQAVHSNTSGSS